ncbi:MAG: hypothetical protein AABZ06_12555 [Bdellovibrionota bacterium]
MPELEPKTVQKELEEGLLWPVYWVHGPETFKVRELVRRIRRVVIGDAAAATSSSLFGLSEQTFDGSDVDGGTVADAALSYSLTGGLRFIVVRDAHAIKNPEQLDVLFGKRGKKEELSSVCVFISPGLDKRRKFSSLLVENVAVVPCEEVHESERDTWIGYLAKRRGLNLDEASVTRLCSLEPWSLDVVDQELEKLAISGAGSLQDLLMDPLLPRGGTEAFVESFFSRDYSESMHRVAGFAGNPDDAIPLVGLIAWNARQLILYHVGGARPNRYIQDKLRRWSNAWSFREALDLQHELAALDYELKQTPALPLGVWAALVMQFCKAAL